MAGANARGEKERHRRMKIAAQFGFEAAIDGLENPTSEVMAEWFMAQIKPNLPGKTVTLRIYETPRYWVEHTA